MVLAKIEKLLELKIGNNVFFVKTIWPIIEAMCVKVK